MHGKPATVVALDATETALGYVNGVALTAGDLHERGAAAVVEVCRATRPNASKVEREACVASFGYSPAAVAKWEQLTKDLATAQDALADVFVELRRVLPELEERIRKAEKAIREAR